MGYYDDKTTDNIQTELLDSVSDDYEKSIGHPTYDTLKPTAIELTNVYGDLDNILSKLDVDNLTGAELEKFVEQRTGIQKKIGTFASTDLTVTGTGTVTAGSQFETKAGIQYACTADAIINGTGTVPVQAVEVGTYGNTPANAITQMPVTIQGITSVTNLQAITNGYDVESDDSLRQRYYERLRTPATSGNKYDYINWAKEVTGVGEAKCFPEFAGNGTVKVVISNENKRAADSNLVNAAQTYIENVMPIGCKLTVTSATEKAINVSAKVVLAGGYTLQQVQDNFTIAVQKYLNDIAFADTYISYAKVGSLLLSTDGITDYSSLTLNTGTSNVALADEEIPVLSTVSLGV